MSMEKVKEKLRENKRLHNIISGTYRNTLYLFTSGYIKGVTLYCFKTRKAEIKKLKQAGFKNIKMFKSRTWKYGGGLDNVFRRYYKAVIDGKDVFIKVAENDATIENELKLNEYLKPFNLRFVCAPRRMEKQFAENTVMIANDFAAGLKPFSAGFTDEELTGILKKFVEITEELEKVNVVHADIHEKNLMVDGGNNLLLLDFGISGIKGQENGVDYVARPGTFYRVEDNGKTRIYDDAYSFVMMCGRLGLDERLKDNAEYKKICGRIDSNVLKVSV